MNHFSKNSHWVPSRIGAMGVRGTQEEEVVDPTILELKLGDGYWGCQLWECPSKKVSLLLEGHSNRAIVQGVWSPNPL